LLLAALAPAATTGVGGAAAATGKKDDEEDDADSELDRSADEVEETARDTPLLTCELTRDAAARRLSPAVTAYCWSEDPL